MKKDIILINPFKSIVPRKLLERLNRDDEFYITETTTLSNLDEIAEEKAASVAIWFLSRAIQLKKNIAEFNEFNRVAAKFYVKVVLVIGDGSMPKIKTDAIILPLNKANKELQKLLLNHFGKNREAPVQSKSVELVNLSTNDKSNDSPMAAALLGGSKRGKRAVIDQRMNKQLEGLFGKGEEQVDEIDSVLAKMEGRHHPIHDANIETDEDRKKLFEAVKKARSSKGDNREIEDIFIDIMKGKESVEFSEFFDEITEKDEKKIYLQDISENCPHISLWSPSGRLDINCFLKIEHIDLDNVVIKWVMNKKGIKFTEEIASAVLEELCIRGSTEKGGLFFIVKNLKKYLQGDVLKIPVPEIMWKVERREKQRLKFLSWEKNVLRCSGPGSSNATYEWRIMDISEDGVKVSLSKDDQMVLSENGKVPNIKIQIKGREILLDGLVVWLHDIGFTTISRREKYAAGIKFLNISSEDKTFVQNHINEKLQLI